MVNICKLCRAEEEDGQHTQSAIHRFNYMLASYQQDKASFRSSRNGVNLLIDLNRENGLNIDFNKEHDKKGNYFLSIPPDIFRSHGHRVEFSCTVENARTGNQEPIVITHAGILHPLNAYSMIDPRGNLDNGKGVKLVLQKDEDNSHEKRTFLKEYKVIIRLQLDAGHVSKYKIPIYFTIQPYSPLERENFTIARSIVVSIEDHVHEEERSNKSPFTSTRWEKMDREVSPKNHFPSADNFPIPPWYFKTLISSFEDQGNGALQEIRRKMAPGYLTENNYNDFFHILIWIEEAVAFLGLSCYNMENVHLEYLNKYLLQLEVPGLAEKRPSVIRGDVIEIKVHGDHTSYKGIIRAVGDKTVDIENLADEIMLQIKRQPQLEIDVRFHLGRIHFERMHEGVEQVVASGFVKNLFPKKDLLNKPVHEPIKLTERELVNKSIARNREQLTAVHKIINNTSGSVPYIVDGPPGTGKTVTIVEAILQIKKQPNKRILICAPANAACNMLTQKLRQYCHVGEMKRIMSQNCDLDSVPDDILSYCNIIVDGTERLVVPFLKENLSKYQIVITTLILAGRYNRIYHPDVVFIDEAAQAREPEACCAIGLLKNGKQLVLAGDPRQLGPVMHCKTLLEYEYDRSLLERLMELDLYKQDYLSGRNNFYTKLKLNFRSHRDILEIPNYLFYGGELKPASADAQSDPLSKTFIYKMLVEGGRHNSVGAAIEFCSVLDKERRHGKSPSYYNQTEATVVRNVIRTLLHLRFPDVHDNVKPEEIGVVTPYIRQVYKIKEIVKRDTGMSGIEVGTTETFQGREKRVIIISTVRSQEDLLLNDKKYNIGFVGEKKRFNVAVTRTKTKLIVVGNPLILSQDTNWRTLIEKTQRLGTLCGAPFSLRDAQLRENITSRFSNANLKKIRTDTNVN